MQELDDLSLLREFTERNSGEAFAALVERRINKVYSVALRHTRNPHSAEEITQAVFVILAQKASRLRKGVVLEGWLYQTARLTAATFIRGEIRRARREQEAHMQTVSNENETELWAQIAPELDAALAGLNQTDRNAVVLRFFYGKSMSDIGTTLGATEEGARKRVSRAIDKLQKYFFKRGITSTAETAAGAISANSVQAAPAALIKTTIAVALANGAVASTSTVVLAKATLMTLKIKTVVATTAAVVVIAGVSVWLAELHSTHQSPPPPAALDDKVPIQMANADFSQDGNQDGTFLVGVDSSALRTAHSAPAIHIKGPTKGSANNVPNAFAAKGVYKKTDNSSSMNYSVDENSPLYGKRVRVTFWLKTRDVKGWVGTFVIIRGSNRLFQHDDMSDRPIRGTTDWQQYEIVTDLPKESCSIYFGPDLYGPGEVWADDFQIDLAPADDLPTDDRNWRISDESDPTVYSDDTDMNVTHDGHSTVCFAYNPDGVAPRGTHTRLQHDFYGSDSDKYSGHTVRMSGWIKTENVSGRIEPFVCPYSGWNNLLARDSMARDYSLKGTLDWTQFSVTCAIPNDTEYLRTGFTFFGSGKAWIDEDSIKYEIVK